MPDEAYYIGLMSGTSMDALDAVIVRFPARGISLDGTSSTPFPDKLKQGLREVSDCGVVKLASFAQLDQDLARFQADCIKALLTVNDLAATDITAIGSHGQTLSHAPDACPPYTLQIGDPATLSTLSGIDVVANFRQQDIAAGGQGAPLVPAFHQAMWRSSTEERVILNLGGISNITLLPAGRERPVTGLDCGPANTLMDAWIHRIKGEDMDDNGSWASSGKVHTPLLKRMLTDPYFARPGPKSTSTEYFNLKWLLSHIDRCKLSDPNPADIQATLSALTVESIAGAIERFTPRAQTLYVCGGGTSNGHLISSLSERLHPVTVTTTGSLGLPTRWVEATAFAWLARENILCRPANIPTVTGANRGLILGGLYRGRQPKSAGDT